MLSLVGLLTGVVFVSAGLAQVAEPSGVTVAAAGNIACDPSKANFDGANPATCQHRQTAKLLADSSAVFVLGDNQYYSGTLAKYKVGYGATESWGPSNLKVHPVPGNHDYKTSGAAGYFDYFAENSVNTGTRGKGWYSFDSGAWHIIALNSNCSKVSCGSSSEQVVWLENDLKADTHSCQLAFWHHPRFWSRGTGTPVPNFWSKLYKYGADVVLNGHQHSYERFAPMNKDGTANPTFGIREFIVGTGGYEHVAFENTWPTSEVRNNTDYGVLKLTLLPTSYTWTFLSISGQVLDSGSGTCHGKP
jgi:calcineurin-like phosphoesterase family protein